MSAGIEHPDPVTLVHYHLGRLTDQDHLAVERHVAACRACAARLEATRHTFDHGLSVDLNPPMAAMTDQEKDLPFAAEIDEEPGGNAR